MAKETDAPTDESQQDPAAEVQEIPAPEVEKPELDLEGVIEGEQADASPTSEDQGDIVQPEPAEATAEGSEVEPPPSFIDQLAAAGFENVQDENDAQARLLEAFLQAQQQQADLQKNLQEQQAMAQYGQQYLEQLREQNKEDAKPKEEDTRWWTPPSYETDWLSKYREQDPETGEVRWKADTPANVRTQMEDYQAYIDKWVYDLAHSPDKVLPPVIERIADQVFEQKYQARRQEETQNNFVEKVRQENDWLFERDPRTMQRTDKFSAAGQEMMKLMDEAAGMGVNKIEDQWNYASRIYDRDHGIPNAATSAAPTPADRRREHLQRAAPIPDQSGSVPSREQSDDGPRNVNHSPGRQLLDQLEHDGVEIIR